MIAQEMSETVSIYSPEDLKELDTTRIPHHIAIIMDGNRRWARRRQLPWMMGHWEGAETLTKIVRAASQLGIKVLTVYSFSTETWRRSQEEVNALMALFISYLAGQKESMISEGVKLEAIGNLAKLPQEVRDVLDDTRSATACNDKIELVLALSYGGRDDIRRAAVAIVTDCMQGKLNKEDISEDLFSRYLDTSKWKDPDLLIRTSGEKRISNFLLWQISYTEVHTTDVVWPDFSEQDLLSAVIDFQKRERRLGV
jgi:undecaprenyl diphosphate synthase